MKTDLVFGHIEGTKEGQIFASRKELADSGIHTPPMHGIWGREQEGSCSIVISGGYEDDIDTLDYILYTGQGGQDAPGGKQIKDQKFTRGNKGLVLSKEYGLPVRVTRGFQVKNGPENGYRYDGLYYVKEYERIRGKRGFYVCRFHLESEKTIGETINIGSNTEISMGDLFKLIKKKPITPSLKELKENLPSRSAKLRYVIKKEDFYDFKTDIFEKFEHLISIEKFGNKL